MNQCASAILAATGAWLVLGAPAFAQGYLAGGSEGSLIGLS